MKYVRIASSWASQDLMDPIMGWSDNGAGENRFVWDSLWVTRKQAREALRQRPGKGWALTKLQFGPVHFWAVTWVKS